MIEDIPSFPAIKGNAGAEHPHNMLFFDTETITEQVDDRTQHLHLQFGVAERVTFNRGRWGKPTEAVFTSIPEFWDFVEASTRKKSTLWVMAHNLGGFDFDVMGALQPLLVRGWSIEKLIVECPPFVIDFARDGARIRLIDSLNYVKASLEQIGKEVGIPKGVDPGPDRPMSERLEYCRNDVRILRTFILEYMKFVTDNDLGNFGLTGAAQAMNAWRHRFGPGYVGRNGRRSVKVFPTHGPEFEAIERRGYFAGRTGADFLGEFTSPVYCFDVNSLFPAVMKKYKYPYALKGKGKGLPLKHLAALIEKGYGFIADVELEVPEGCDWYPWRGERVTFPVGRFTTTLCTGELALALRHGHVKKVGEWQQYRMADLFTTYVDSIYAMRRRFQDEELGLWAFLCKLLLNSFYGKFGQKIPAWEECKDPGFPECGPFGEPITSPVFMMDGTYYRRLGDVIEKRLPEDRGKARNAFVAIAAHVTSNARLELLRGMHAAGRSEVLYYDTDSLFVTEKGREGMLASGLVDQTELGLWKFEAESSSITIRGPKDYTFGNVTKIKGIRRNATQLDENTFEQDKFHSFKGSIHLHHMGQMVITREVKHLSRKYTKGVLLPAGRVRPFKFPEELPERSPP